MITVIAIFLCHVLGAHPMDTDHGRHDTTSRTARMQPRSGRRQCCPAPSRQVPVARGLATLARTGALQDAIVLHWWFLLEKNILTLTVSTSTDSEVIDTTVPHTLRILRLEDMSSQRFSRRSQNIMTATLLKSFDQRTEQKKTKTCSFNLLVQI